MESYVVESFGQPLTRLLRDTPTPSGTQVLLKVHRSGVCHSDVHMHEGSFDLGGGNKLDMTRFMPLPRALGHEIAGTVMSWGNEAQAGLGMPLRVGDSRVVYPWIGCGQCALCLKGLEQLCGAPAVLGVQHDGGFADHVVVPHPKYLLAHDGVPAEQACTYACAGVTAYSALKKVMRDHGADEPLLLLGAGGVGLSALRLARVLLPHAPIFVADISADKRSLAAAAGANDVFDPSAEGAAKAFMKRTAGGVARAIDFVGAASTYTFGFNALRKGGTLVSVGLFGGVAQTMPVMVAMKAVSVVGSYVGSRDELAELLAWSKQARLPDLLLDERALSQASQALDDLRHGHVQGRIVLRA